MSKLVRGIGISDIRTRDVNGKELKSYSTWGAMLNRAYSAKYHKDRPTYKGCSVCDDWLLFSKYKAWYDMNCIEGYAVDKDILIPGNKEYNPTNCRFVPQHINSLLTDCAASQGEYLIGVSENPHYPHWSRKQFLSQCNTFNIVTGERNKNPRIGCYYTEAEAHLVYKTVKEANVKAVAKYYYDKNLITEEIYTALMKWTVST